jgi:hypothetical protein
VYRPAAVEENGGTYQPAPADVARYFPFEITFKGSESSVREFLNSLGEAESHYFIVRCIRIQNERDTPPRVADAKFETAAAESAPDNLFGDGFFVPDGAEEPGEEVGVEAAPEAAPTVELDTSRILAQVLGGEDLVVFVRFDIAMFLPAKELPKP